MATRAADESAEQARLLRPVDDALGVPLHAEDEGSIGVLDPLDHPVRRPRDRPQPVAEDLDRLVMEGVHLGPGGSERPRQMRVGV